MDNIVSPNMENQNSRKTRVNKKSIIISVVILIVAILALLFFLKYKKSNINNKEPLTKQERIDILNGLKKTPPSDGSVKMTTEEKLEILEDISSKKPTTTTKKVELSAEEQQKLFSSIR
ncbi:hypothetical protein IT400_02280 [Candidatus Nomurabacteria bacterium]|nr:hypothetical protein [Candidatus Nomurabacteria bacterium]